MYAGVLKGRRLLLYLRDQKTQSRQGADVGREATAKNPPGAEHRRRGIETSGTGITGLDEITGGGLPSGRPTLICGSGGCGKALFAMEFLIRGATESNESGVFMAFEKTATDLTENVRSPFFDLDDLVRKKMVVVDYVHTEASYGGREGVLTGSSFPLTRPSGRSGRTWPGSP